MKKLMRLFLVLGLFLAGCSSQSTGSADETTMTLHITVIDQVNDVTLYDDDCTVTGEIETLTDFLAAADELDVVMEDSDYGTTIMGLCGVNTEDWNAGPWWVYDSENNETCQENGMCPASDDVIVTDGDSFTFTFADTF